MIFSIADHIEQIKNGTKTQTRRPTDRYKTGKLYAVQPGRCKKGIPEGKVYIGEKWKEWKPDVSDFPVNSFARKWQEMEAGYPIKDYQAEAEGGYSSLEYEELYETMYPDWKERWVYRFHFFTVNDIIECGETTRVSQQLRKNDP